jgi:hypothetical protein
MYPLGRESQHGGDVVGEGPAGELAGGLAGGADVNPEPHAGAGLLRAHQAAAFQPGRGGDGGPAGLLGPQLAAVL